MDDPHSIPNETYETEFQYTPFNYRHPWYLRIVLGVSGVCLAGLLITAACLEPSERGYGTHRKLGLPPCSVKVMFNGTPCPSCGMTTSWAHLMRGQIGSSLRANPGGTMLGILSLVLVPWLTGTAIKGQWLWGEPPTWVAITISMALLVVILGNWVVQLNR